MEHHPFSPKPQANYALRIISLLSLLIWACITVGQSRYENVLIIDHDGACEPSIAIDPNDPQRVVAGAILDRVAYSEDGGLSWKDKQLKSRYGVWGDPVIDVDANGRFYFFHLANPPEGNWIDRIVCQRSDDGGKTWTDGSYAGLNEDKAQDKHWSVIDPMSGAVYLTWTEFDDYGNPDPECHSRIRFSASVDQGENWSEAVTISELPGNCIDDDETTEGAVPAIGPEGQIYVTWADKNGLNFTSSTDEGKTWKPVLVIDPMPGGWAFDIPGIYRCNGMPITLCDRSGGAHHGRIYVNWSDQRNGEADTDIWMMYSDDEGAQWSAPIRVNNDPPGKQQFFTWMDIDQANGKLYSVFYDRRHHNDLNTDVMLASSTDGGLTWSNELISEEPFIPTKSVFFGDYNDISVVDGQVRPIWTRMVDGKSSVWTAIIDKDTSSDLEAIELAMDFEMPKDGKVCLMMISPDGKEQRLFKKRLSKGKQSFIYLWPSQEIPAGTYRFRLHQRKTTIWSTEKTIK